MLILRLDLFSHLYHLSLFVLNQIMRSKLYPQEQKTGSPKCNSLRCLTCNNIKECDTFTSHVTKETFKINHHFNCNSKCLIYLFSCKVCGKQYVGSTTDKFRYRRNNYKNCQRKTESREDHKQKCLHAHFLREDHDGLLNNVEFTLIEKTDPSDPERRVEFWRTQAILRIFSKLMISRIPLWWVLNSRK